MNNITCVLTNRSHLPGKNRSGTRKAYKMAPEIYKNAMSNNHPRLINVKLEKNPSTAP